MGFGRRHEGRSSRQAMDWKQRLLLAGVPKSARDFLARLEDKPLEPGYVEKFEKIAKDFCPRDVENLTRLTFGLFHNPGRDVAGVVVVVSPVGMLILDAGDGRIYSGFVWSELCRFDVKRDDDYQVVGFSWYDGPQGISERVQLGTPLRPSEMSGGYMYMHADAQLLGMVAMALKELGVPDSIHKTLPLF
jgi:hypothetical protein